MNLAATKAKAKKIAALKCETLGTPSCVRNNSITEFKINSASIKEQVIGIIIIGNQSPTQPNLDAFSVENEHNSQPFQRNRDKISAEIGEKGGEKRREENLRSRVD